MSPKTALAVLLVYAILLPNAFAFDVRPSTRHSSSSFHLTARRPQWKELPKSAAALTTLTTTATSPSTLSSNDEPAAAAMSGISKTLTKVGAIAFIATVALGLITSLSFIKLLGLLGIGTEKRRQRWALSTGQFCARWALRLFPFCRVDVVVDKNAEYMKNPEPVVWVCNHMSMLDVFLLLASDRKMRGRQKRPIKVVYWRQLEDNPFTKILFQQSGFIPIEMTANKPGESNEYDRKSFKTFLKDAKQAFADGFDIGVLPEGQLNPAPEDGLLPLFTGAYTLARMSRRPIQMMALHGVNRLWHPNDGMEVGDMNVTGRQVKIRIYPGPRKYESDEDFKETFSTVVGHFGKYGRDVKDVEEWLDGSKWYEMDQKRKREAKKAEEERLQAELEAQRAEQLAEERRQAEAKEAELERLQAELEAQREERLAEKQRQAERLEAEQQRLLAVLEAQRSELLQAEQRGKHVAEETKQEKDVMKEDN